MLPFQLGLIDGPVHLVALGAHPDDIEIGCGGTLLKLAESVPELTAEFVIATGTPARLEEARRAAELFLPECEVSVTSAGLPDGRLPAHWNETKELLEATAAGGRTPDLVLAPGKHDAHQDHRLIAELAPTVWRNHLVLHYEIPKWDGDFGRPWLYVELTEEQLRDKVALLHKAYPSQVPHDWFDEEVFAGLARLRGMECRAPYAEAFTTAKATLTW
ncbi:PIG-L family deacetylase [Kribbella sp. NPDC051936]|uniref:PIG-L deacetylase family protein n=1 Tax=Kribbella sp. NPDC051936 TaxID=3154946 RepID=UPI00342A026A